MLAGAALSACSDEILDTTRQIPERGTLGEEIYNLLHRDLVRDDQRRADGFARERDPFVGAIDHLFPPGELRYTQDFLVKLLPLYDDGTIPEATRTFAAIFDRLANDRDALRSLSAIAHRIGYVDRAHELALIRRIHDRADYPALMKALLRLQLAHDGLDAEGEPDPNEPAEMQQLLRMMSNNLRELELSDDAERNIVLATDLLLQEDERFSDPQMAHAPARIVARDPRGMAKLSAIAEPFTDRSPADGLPDVDTSGRFIGSNGAPIELPPFSADGTAAPMYQYVDLQKTMLAGVLRDTRTLIEDGVPMKALRTAKVLLGERSAEGTYTPFNSPILELTHALGSAAKMNTLPEALELIRVLLDEHEATLAWVQLETEAQLDIADTYNINLKQGSTFFEDLLNVIRKILREPGLAEDVLAAIQDPAFAQLDDAQILLLSHKKDRISEGDFNSGNIFSTPVDRSSPDRRGNESLQQRLLHLIYDTKGARYTPEFIGIPIGFIFEIDDLAEFYLLSIIGESHVPSLVSTLTGLSTTPTPEELAVFINREQDFGNPQGHEGIDVMNNDGDTLYAATASGMTGALRPLIRAFYNKGQMPLLFELFEVLHLHWGTQQGDWQDANNTQPRYSKLSGIRAYEPLLIETFQRAPVLDATRKLLDETKDLRTQKGRRAHDMLLTIARKLFDKDTALYTLDGKREVLLDGQRITPLSPFDLIRAARAKIKSTVRRSAAAQADYDALIDALHALLLAPTRTGPEAGMMTNRRAIPLAVLLLRHLEARAQRHDQARDLDAWVTTDFEQGVTEMITSEDLPAILDLIDAIEADVELTATLTSFRDELLDEQRGFPDLLVTAGDLLEALKDASVAVHFARFLGRELDPNEKVCFTAMTMMQKALDLDPDEHMLEVVRRAIDSPEEGRLYMDGLGAAIRQANRTNPLEASVVSPEDLQQIAATVAQYLLDDQQGLEKFYDMVESRTLAGRNGR